MAIPGHEDCMLPLLRRVAERGEQHWRVFVDMLADDFALSPDERTVELPSGRGVTVIRSRVGWARSYLVQAGLLEAVRRGVIKATPRGLDVLRAPPQRLDNAYLRRFPEFLTFMRRARESQAGAPAEGTAVEPAHDTPSPASSPAERLEAADREMKAALTADLLARVRRLGPAAFEQLIVDLLVGMGYGGSHRDAAQRLGRSGDGGIDGIVRADALGLNAVYMQAKCYAEDNPVGAPAIQGFAGALLGNGATRGVFVTTSRFTPGARQAADRYTTHRIVLIDGDELARLMIEHEVGVRTARTIRVQRLDLATYEDDDA